MIVNSKYIEKALSRELTVEKIIRGGNAGSTAEAHENISETHADGILETHAKNTSGTHTEKVETAILTEHVMKLVVIGERHNDEIVINFVCTPENLVELVCGRLLTERLISSKDDISELSISESGEEAVVKLNKGLHRVERTISKYDIPSEWIFKLADEFADETKLYRKTKSAHSAILAKDGQSIFKCEDLGRHNAIDKCAGYALLTDIALEKSYIYTSGRVPKDMAMKVAGAGIPVMISKAAPTSEAIGFASGIGLTIIAKARTDSYLKFT